MKLIDSIKEQVSAIVNYKATTLEALEVEFEEIKARINEGVEKMKATNELATVFDEQEIKEIDGYAKTLLCNRYREMKCSIIDATRRNFVF